MEYNLVDDTLDVAMQIVNGAWKSFVFGGVGYVFINVLIEHDGIFSFYRPFIQKILYGAKFQRINTFTKKLDQVLTICPKCFAGQLAFWVYLLDFKGLFGWAACVCFSILFAKLLSEKW